MVWYYLSLNLYTKQTLINVPNSDNTNTKILMTNDSLFHIQLPIEYTEFHCQIDWCGKISSKELHSYSVKKDNGNLRKRLKI